MTKFTIPEITADLAKYKSDDDLILGVLLNLKPTGLKPMWVQVKDNFGVGSTVAHLICGRFGFNPNATSREQRYAAVTK